MSTDSIKTLVESYNKAKQQMQKDVIKSFKLILAELFEKYPEVQSFGVPAYTPYFCDGDPCHYGVCEYSIQVNRIDPDTDEEKFYDEKGNYSNEKYKEWEKTFGKARDEFSKLIRQIPDEVFESSFNEGLIMFYRDGKIEVDDYYHE